MYVFEGLKSWHLKANKWNAPCRSCSAGWEAVSWRASNPRALDWTIWFPELPPLGLGGNTKVQTSVFRVRVYPTTNKWRTGSWWTNSPGSLTLGSKLLGSSHHHSKTESVSHVVVHSLTHLFGFPPFLVLVSLLLPGIHSQINYRNTNPWPKVCTSQNSKSLPCVCQGLCQAEGIRKWVIFDSVLFSSTYQDPGLLRPNASFFGAYYICAF